MKAIVVSLLVACASGFVPGYARAEAPAPFKVPELTGTVVDEANWLSDSDRARIDDLVRRILAKGKAQMAVYIPSSLQGYDIETASIQVAEAWKLGGKKDDRGVLLVVAPNEKKMRIEVGYGLEGELTDARSRRILDDVLKPYLRESRPGDGIYATVEAIGQALDSPGVDVGGTQPERVPVGAIVALILFGLFLAGSVITFSIGSVAGIIAWVVTRNLFLGGLVFFFIASAFRRRARGLFTSGWGRGSGGGFGSFGGGGFGGGGGGWSGGGGSFGGGGSSSSW